ncbi:MAG: glycosyltransferase family 4 protein [Patescibacteria group bacterium]
MKLLIVTQKVDINDDVLGFMHGWIAEFAKNCEQVTVICLKQGQFDLPHNVKILSLGKEHISQKSKVHQPASLREALLAGKVKSKLKYTFNFYKYIWQEKKNYNHVWVHMNPEYILLGGLFWRLMGKKISLWYAHGQATWKLRMAEKIVNIIFTSTNSGCRIKSKKIKIIGQGIDIKNYELRIKNYELEKNNNFKIVTVGRISPVKDYETLIKAVELLNKAGMKLQVDIIGGAGLPEQKKYLVSLEKMVQDKELGDVVNFIGPVPNKNIVKHLQSSDLFVNMSHTGSLDKAIAEAMSCGLPILTCNEALEEVLGNYEEMLMYNKGDYCALADKIKFIAEMDINKKIKLGKDLREIIVKNHSLEGFIINIISAIQRLK